jgi:hypothetical protein
LTVAKYARYPLTDLHEFDILPSVLAVRDRMQFDSIKTARVHSGAEANC